MKAILMPIRPQHLVNILNGKKTIELRKKFPSDFRGWVYAYCTLGRPYLGYDYDFYKVGEDDYEEYNIYELHDTRGDWTYLNGKVVCRFWVDKVDTIIRSGMGYYVEGQDRAYTNRLANQSSLTFYDLQERFGDNNFKAIHISKLEIFDKPKELGEFWADPIDFQVHTKAEAIAEGYRPIQRAPQSWQYIYIEEDK